MADPYDFQIESMKFRMAVTDKTPYVRTTAPFRKEQFDSSPTVGDQSLTGWWTRGQLSFHKGAGLNYYEVLEGDEVLDRFTSSSGISVFEPGIATLDTDTFEYSSLAVTEVRWVEPYNYNTYSSGLFIVSTLAAEYRSTADDTTPTPFTANAGVINTGVVGAPGWFYLATGGSPTYYVEAFYGATFQETYYSSTTPLRTLWYGKGRLFILDASGDLYQVSARPTGPYPITLANPICNFPDHNSSDSASFTDAGGAVYVSMNQNLIYSLTPESDGSIATLSAPIVAGVLPFNERVKCIRAHVGLLTIVTNQGVRFATMDGGSLTIGPLALEWAGSGCTHIGAVGARVYVTGWDGTDCVGYEFDLSSSIAGSPLIYPHREMFRNGPDYGGTSGATEQGGDTSGTGVCWYGGGDNTIVVTNVLVTDKASSGELTTAYHRFGTLDPKRFQKVSVRASGSGTVQVYQVEADGTETSLGTMNAADGSGTFNFATTDPVERMALKFVLTRDAIDATLGPTLLGYQIKALPVPERQRILKVPLQVQDELTLRRGTRAGHRGMAYEDITELETLEKNQAVVTFTDHRTGETGTAYIDQVDFQGETPSSQNTNGFGGIAYVTLRVLS